MTNGNFIKKITKVHDFEYEEQIGKPHRVKNKGCLLKQEPYIQGQERADEGQE